MARASAELPAAAPESVEVADIVVPEYQRPLIEKWAENIAQNWDPNRFRPPLLARNSEGKYEVIDGQHTVEAVRRRGHKRIPAYVRSRMTLPEEAGVFADLNTQRKPLRPFQVWNAERMAGRGWAVELDEVARQHGLTVAHERGPNNLACIAQCRAILKRYGRDTLSEALEVLTRAYDNAANPEFDTRVERGLVSGMVDLISKASDTGLYDKDRWVERLKKATYPVRVEDLSTEVRLTPRSLGGYVGELYATGKMALRSTNTGSGQAPIIGFALAQAILGFGKAKKLYDPGK